MPTVAVGRDALYARLGRTYSAPPRRPPPRPRAPLRPAPPPALVRCWSPTQQPRGRGLTPRAARAAAEEEFDELCFEFGIELDEVTSEKQMLRKELGETEAEIDEDDEVLYKIDIPANRYDLLCIEGIARGLNVFLGNQANPTYALTAPPAKLTMTVKPETAMIRPFVVCAVLRGVTFTPENYKSFIDLQDKLHTNICRERTLVAIGTHDLDTLEGPFTYEALPPEDIRFVPLKQEREFSCAELMEYYKGDQKLKKFLHIVQNSPVFPVIYDSRRTVLSFPPIINGAHSAIHLGTQNVFIECTATDRTKADIVLNTVCAMFTEYCGEPFTIEPVDVVDASGQLRQTPCLDDTEFRVDVEKVNSCVGHRFEAQEVASILGKMQLKSRVDEEGMVRVMAPITRSDVLHPCDIYEDVAIAFGYNNLERTVPKARTMGKELPINQLSELLRMECAMAGFTEVLTWALCSHAEIFEKVRREDDGKSAVTIGNPKTLEFQVCRNSLLPAALKTLGANKDAALPLKLFEVSDVVLLDEGTDTGSRNERRLVAVYSAKASGLEVIQGMLNRVMEVCGVPWAGSGAQGSKVGTYDWKEKDSATFFPGRAAEITYNGQAIGSFGVVHPEVLAAFDIPFPTSAVEINLQCLCFDQFGEMMGGT